MAALAVLSCRTPEESDSAVAADAVLPDVPGPNAIDSQECGRDGGTPTCSVDKICVQPKGGPGLGRCNEDPDREHRPALATKLVKLKTKAAMGDTKLTVTANVMRGSNPCAAKGRSAELVTVVKNVGDLRVIHVWPVANITGPTNDLCGQENNPQYKKTVKILTDLLNTRDRVVVHGISDLDSRNAKLVFGAACPISEYSQPPPRDATWRPLSLSC